MVHYDFIKVDNTRRIEIPQYLFTRRNTLEKCYQITLNFKVQKPIHVGSGTKDWDFTKNILILKNYRSADDIRIPGSSLKGLTSFNYLALTGRAALASELFGSTRGKAAISKVYFNDLIISSGNKNPVKKDVDRMYRPRNRRPNHVKFFVRRAPKTSYYGKIETYSEQSILTTNISGIGLELYEVGGIVMSLGAYLDKNGNMNSRAVKIGYAKPQCFGRMQLIPDKISIDIIKFQGLSIIHESLSNVSSLLVSFIEYMNKLLKYEKIMDRFNKLFKDECLVR
ncbi:MAG: RAMP superfamily CRISPR-associated protein [Candidatus Helarchaeota archaeon]